MLEHFSLVYNPLTLVIYLLASFLLGVLIAVIYKKSHSSISYSHTFATTLVLLLPVITMLIVFISNSIPRAIGVFGAFSVLRFRTAIKDSRDMFFLFWVLSTGVMIGGGYVLPAVLVTGVIAGFVVFLHKMKFGKRLSDEYILTYIIDTAKSDEKSLLGTLTVFTVHHHTISAQTIPEDHTTEVAVLCRLKADKHLSQFVSTLQSVKGIRSVHLHPCGGR